VNQVADDFAAPSAREGQWRSPFTVILETLCDSCLGAIGAGLVDDEGECVDFAFLPTQDIPAYDIKLTGAHLQIVMREAQRSAKLEAAWGAVHQMWIHTDDFSYVLVHLRDGYVLVLICRSDALSTVSPRALRQVEVELHAEAGWPLPEPHQPYWRRAHVLLDQRGQPVSLRYAQGFVVHSARQWDANLRVLAVLENLASFERGFQVLASTGETIHLVREPSGYWYAGLPIHTRLSRR
jgi:hypothetical protein